MGFSVADFGFWRLAGLALVFEVAHALVEGHWAAVRGARLGPRPLSAVLFMFAEAVTLMLVVMAAIGTVTRIMKARTPHLAGILFAVLGVTLVECGLFFLLWQH